ncbi:glycosyltransferase [Proteus sp. CD3]|uniref:glycosyltransferase n=1 Tax=Proteus sp. CD3 TaxID=1921565 RepID=UPI00124A5660|nr:glycosyltransferase [Proteus sp. CD3]QEZ93970.1 hypothetical protein BTA34_17155 [Proteus sp. CD3]
MKKKSVLIYGEYSGYGKSLVKGFLEIGYTAQVLSFSGDGFKKINTGMQLKGKNKLIKLISLFLLIPKILSYKNILVMNPDFFKPIFLGPLIFLLLKLMNKNIILLCCGDDVEFIKQGKLGNIENWPYTDIELPKKNYFNRRVDILTNYVISSSSRKIIPVMYDYYKAWSLSQYKDKLTETIPLACDGNVKKINKKNFDKEKIVIMHGINREGFKGSKVIKQALQKIEEKYKDKVEILFPEKLPLTEYLQLMEKVDIAIDQTKSNSYGMNAIYSMLSGHVVLAPANELFQSNIKISNCPIISINNTPDSIIDALEKLILAPDQIYSKKLETQQYAIKLHNCKSIAIKIDKHLKI